MKLSMGLELMEKIELKEGQVWQVPDKKWIRVRRFIETAYTKDRKKLAGFIDLGSWGLRYITYKAFLQWIRRNNAKLVGMVDSKTGKVRVK